MISVNFGQVHIEGSLFVLMGETTCLLHSMYEAMVKQMGKERADVEFAKLGRYAVASDDELDKMTDDALKESGYDSISDFKDSLEDEVRGILGEEGFNKLNELLEEFNVKGDN